MQITKLRATLLGGLLVAAAIPLAAAPASALNYTTKVVLRGSPSDGADFAGGTHGSVVSPDGAWLGFSRLGADGGTYRKSLLSGATELVSLNDAGQPANKPSTVVGMSFGGGLVAFETAATNMGEGPATSRDLYLRNVAARTTYRVNIAPGSDVPIPVKAGESAFGESDIVAFTSATTNHVYARNWYGKVTQQVDVSSAEVSTAGGSKEPSVSSNGRYVTFTSSGSDLVPGDTNFVPDVFRRDLVAGTTIRVSVAHAGGQLNLGSGQSSVSDDGRFVAFTSEATDATGSGSDLNDSTDVFRRDTLGGGATIRYSVQTAGGAANHDSSHPAISDDGQTIAFESRAENLDEAPKNGKADVFVRTLGVPGPHQVGVRDGVAPSQGAYAPSISGDGRSVAFDSATPGVSYPDNNGAVDAFIERQDTIGPFSGYGLLTSRMVADFDVSASSAEIYQATQRLIGGKVTPTHLILGYAHGVGWAQHREPVIRLYEAFFHRQPDLGGLTYWIQKRQQGTKLGVIASSFSASPEFKNTYGNVSNTDFVKLVYVNVLDREADAAGLAHWVGKMAGGMSRGDVMVAFSESSEGVRTLSVPVDATLVGLGLFGTMPPKALYDQAVHTAYDMAENEWVVQTYLLSPEYVQFIQK